jgi:3-methyladenine DNA glycosylase AlkD
MPPKTKRAPAKAATKLTTKPAKTPTKTPAPKRKAPSLDKLDKEVAAALAWLEEHGTKKTKDGMVGYGIHAEKAFGVTMADMRTLAKSLGRNHALAAALWETGWYEARMVTSFIDEPARVTPAQMDRWCHDFDNWAICDTVCFHLFDRTPHAFDKVAKWAGEPEEFVKRAAFALLASLALHGKDADDAAFTRCLPLAERAATDDRNFVKKSVSWALRAVGRRSAGLNVAAVDVARRLADAEDPTARWVGRDVIRDLTRPSSDKRRAPARPADRE